MATTAKRTRRKLDTSTTTALVAMTENGLSRKDAGRALGLSKEQVDRALDTAALELKARASDYVNLHFQAAQVAAEKGKSAPMEWALERMGVVQPPAPAAPQGGGGTVIKIGIALPGLAPDSAKTITVTNAPATSED